MASWLSGTAYSPIRIHSYTLITLQQSCTVYVKLWSPFIYALLYWSSKLTINCITLSVLKHFLSIKYKNQLLHTVPLNYNFISTRVYTRGTTTNLHPLPVTCLRGPRFLVAWNIHASCRNTRGITRYVEEHGTYKFTHVLFSCSLTYE